MNSVWWPVREDVAQRRERASSRLIAKPRIINQATCAPNWFCAMPTMASLVGTTPLVPAAPLDHHAQRPQRATTSPAPAPMSRKPSVAFNAPPITLTDALAQRDQADGGDDADEIGRDGRISLTTNSAMATNQFIAALLLRRRRITQSGVDLPGGGEVVDDPNRNADVAEGLAISPEVMIRSASLARPWPRWCRWPRR